jgi:hypothetical protein
VFGVSDARGFTPKQWQFAFNYRGLKSDDHYSGTQFQYQRESAGTYVVNTQQLYDFSATYNFTNRVSVTGSLPVINSSWSIPTPIAPTPGQRREQNSSGIGDAVAIARFWLMDPDKHAHGNVSGGVGIKAPTGDYDVQDEYPDLLTGSNNTLKAVDQSIQAGDGGWGAIFDLQAYRNWEHVTLYGSGTYLVNPRDTNGTPSIVVGLGFAANPAVQDLLENSVPDQYIARLATAFPVAKTPLSLSLGFRIEGMPRYDLIGDSHGFRRPGYETYVEPGIVYSHGVSTWSLYVPKGLVRNRRPNPYTGNPGDATFPDYVILFGYSYRFGGESSASRPVPDLPPAPEKPASPTGSSGLPVCGS